VGASAAGDAHQARGGECGLQAAQLVAGQGVKQLLWPRRRAWLLLQVPVLLLMA
jgi:hypothetical protein